ncbi:hypothetical protein J6590_095547 [Homalodisca vitripennis]|nr:hypothetical protein J6590_095547 [Homalodisca vitripennis]
MEALPGETSRLATLYLLILTKCYQHLSGDVIALMRLSVILLRQDLSLPSQPGQRLHRPVFQVNKQLRLLIHQSRVLKFLHTLLLHALRLSAELLIPLGYLVLPASYIIPTPLPRSPTLNHLFLMVGLYDRTTLNYIRSNDLWKLCHRDYMPFKPS